MLRRFRHAFLGAALIAATVAAPPIASTAGAQANQWEGFAAVSAPSQVHADSDVNASPAFSAGVTRDLGGAGVDIWVNNHAEESEALQDISGAGEVASVVGAGGDATDTHGVTFTDIDGDGDEDLIEVTARDNATRVFRNDSGRLVRVTGTQLDDTAGRGRQGVAVDFNLDGNMDVLVTNLCRGEETVFCQGAESSVSPSELYLGNGDFTWEKVDDPSGVISDADLRWAQVTSTGPGEPNVIVTSNDFTLALDTITLGGNSLSDAENPVNQIQGALDSATRIRDVALGDIDGDLAPEFVIARQDDFLETDVEGGEPVDGEPTPDDEPDLLGQLPIGIVDLTTNELSEANDNVQGVADDSAIDNCRGVSLADFDNDADLDIFGACTMVESGQDTNAILLNDGNGNFTVGAAGLVPSTTSDTARTVVNGDFNDDGWVDAFVTVGHDGAPGGVLVDGVAEDIIFINEGGANNWLQIDLVASRNPDAVGAQVFVGTNKWQVRETGHRVHNGQDSRTLHFGLGGEDEIAPVEIRWPDGTFERCDVDDVNQRVTIEQGGDNCVESTQAGLRSAVAAEPDLEPAIPAEPDPDPDPVLCNGLEVTINLQLNPNARATNSHDVILGTEGADVIDGLDGRDTICALGGDDIINAGQGRDWVDAGAGDDEIEAGQGADIVEAGAGNDVVVGGRGNDTIFGGSGDDNLRGQDGIDAINGNGGDDELRGGNKADSLIGGGGDDLLIGQTRADFLDGGAGIDEFVGGGGVDVCTPDPQGNVESRSTCELTSR